MVRVMISISGFKSYRPSPVCPRPVTEQRTSAQIRKRLESLRATPKSGVKVVINVGGRRFITWEDTLRRFPHTLLGSEELSSKFYDKERKEYFIDRDPHLFRYILNYYRNGKLHRSLEDCTESFEEELTFYGIRSKEVHDCCFDEDQDMEKEDMEKKRLEALDKEKLALKLPTTKIGKFRRYIWKTMEGEIEKGPRAVIGMGLIYFVGLFILLSIFTTVYETVPCQGGVHVCKERTRILDLLDEICIGIFTVEFLVRLSVCPDYLVFIKTPMNVIDFFSILPFYMRLLLQSVAGSNLEAFVVLRVLRIFRVFKLSRHSKRLQRFGSAIITCIKDMTSLMFVLFIFIILFSSMMYFIERDAVEGMFTSIPDSMWFTIVTMITLGYGDMVPSTTMGQILGAVCCVSGVILIALPIPIIQEKDIFKKNMLTVYNVEDLQKKIEQMRAGGGEDGDEGRVRPNNNSNDNNNNNTNNKQHSQR
ncbi:potassium voltage-gated channel protein Shal-like [Nematostella vectensis]|uniref:potassium voltage-gated channel protein Shal-like n=1 Tax=Nematostella vectensis TaxID=45351 RepID=UPI00207756C4|nr:potassium voltage-gated channel protein Shal-like [Nematostella vectensis]XP_048588077.1 potassium voltage-gated channel protein Shal-like [Nematostella vectensis]XP_048588085.1 potassium voltage-gated channel protein Shal-like [Nematostella vectensis]XP_048588093.1 potassium voltage-gated channel protein Shal-like [Nematostella vectensis]XP_048588098.1 potassium voltage-gated channel protein Shal-like [Nematostella vectensis]